MAKFYIDLADNIYNILSTGFDMQLSSGFITDEYGLELTFNRVKKIGTPIIFSIKDSSESIGLTALACADDPDTLSVVDPHDVGIMDETSHLVYSMYAANSITVMSKLERIKGKLNKIGQTDLAEHLDRLIDIAKSSNRNLNQKSFNIDKLSNMQLLITASKKV